jgi:predicted phage baseplate assembly protein
MPIQPPALDDRSFQDLVDDLLARIPAHAPEYRHVQVGDPGRTLIELFAWLGDTILYRANLIPERQRLAFLRLLGIPLRAATPARGLCSLLLKDEGAGCVVLPALTKTAGPVPFETRQPLSLLPVSAQAFYKRPLSDAEGSRIGAEVLARLPEVYQLGGKAPRYYVTTPVFPGGEPDSTGFDLVRDTLDGSLWLAIMAPVASAVAAVRETLGRGLDGDVQVLNVGVAPALEVPAWYEDVAQRARVPHVWELTTSGATGQPRWVALETVSDTTIGLTRRGVLRLLLPPASSIGAPPSGLVAPFEAGVGEGPPRLDDSALAERVVTWLRLRPLAQAGQRVESLRLSWVGINAVEIDQRQTGRPVVVGTSNGAPDQELFLGVENIEAETLQVEVEQDSGFVRWVQIDDLALAGRDDAVFTLDPEAGFLRFGDGMRGAIPRAGGRVRALYRSGGGRSGNLPPKSLTQLKDPLDLRGERVTRPIKVEQQLSTDGGQDRESLAEAERRIPALLRHRDRAVTTEDYQRVAADTPGVQLGRVEVLPRFKPQQRRSDVPGVVSVMVLPYKSVRLPPNPRVDRPLIEAVHGYLDARRPLGTEMYVIGCEYVALALGVGVELREDYPREETLLAVREALRRFLWPLAPGGPEGTGWPLGRPVRDRELEVVVAQVPGIIEVYGVSLFERQQETWRRVTTLGTTGSVALPLDPWALPELLAVLVVTDDPPTDPELLPNPFGEDGVAVPVVPETC